MINKEIKILYMNIRNIHNKIDIVISELSKDKDVIVFTESWLHNNETAFFNIPNFSAIHSCRPLHKDGGGVVIYIRNEFDFSIINTYDNLPFNTIHIKIENTSPKLNLIATYNPHKKHTNIFTEYLEEIIQNLKNCIIIGDTNVNIIDKNDNSVCNYIEMFESHNYSFFNTCEPTRTNKVNEERSTLLDHVISNSSSFKIDISLEEVEILSDHKLQNILVKNIEKVFEKMENFEIKKINYSKCLHIMKKTLSQLNNDLTLNKLIQIINDAKVQSTTIHKIRHRKNNEWFSKEISEKLKIKQKLYNQHKKNKSNPVAKEVYSKMKNEINRQIKLEKQRLLEQSLQSSNSSKELWKNINKYLLRKFKNKSKLDIDPNEMNNFFSTIGKNLAKHFNDPNNPEQPPPIPTLHPIAKLNSFSQTDVKEIELIISKLKDGAPGPDGILVKELKMFSNIISLPLSIIINKSIEEKTFPDIWKECTISPIYKSGNKKDVGNYRPIALLNTMSKIFEKIIKKRINIFLEENKIFDKNQFGFQSNSNTTSAISEIYNLITSNLDKGNYVVLVLIDLKKAFDTVNHTKLLTHLQNCGIVGNALALIQSYLSNRKIKTIVNKILSNEASIDIGLPQGSVLGPLFYLLYILAMKFLTFKGIYKVFADDTAFVYHGKNSEEIVKQFSDDMKIYSKWLAQNELTINTQKTKFIVFQNKNKEVIHPNLFINKTKIEEVDQEKYLGVLIDKNLNFSPHIEKIKTKLSCLTKVLSPTCPLNKKVAKHLYNSFYCSHVNYSSIVWSNTTVENLNNLNACLNRALKTLYGYNPKIQSTFSLYHSTNNMNLEMLIEYERIKYIHKIINNLQKSNIPFQTNSVLHYHNTRTKSHLHLENTRTNKGKYLNSMFSTYNCIPNNLKQIKKFPQMKLELKQYIFSKHKNV